jgi:hypothetical protein
MFLTALLANPISLLNSYSLFVNARKATRGIECHNSTLLIMLCDMPGYIILKN